jgi:hypothetical protein
MMAAVAVVGVVAATAMLVGEMEYWTTSHGWNTSVLPPGMRVSTCRDTKMGQTMVPAGTRCVVVEDSTDEDSAYPYRKVSVGVTQGPHAGLIFSLERTDLRAD